MVRPRRVLGSPSFSHEFLDIWSRLAHTVDMSEIDWGPLKVALIWILTISGLCAMAATTASHLHESRPVQIEAWGYGTPATDDIAACAGEVIYDPASDVWMCES